MFPPRLKSVFAALRAPHDGTAHRERREASETGQTPLRRLVAFAVWASLTLPVTFGDLLKAHKEAQSLRKFKKV